MEITAEARLVLSASEAVMELVMIHCPVSFGIGKRGAFNRCQHGRTVDTGHTDVPALGVAVVRSVIHHEGDRAGKIAR